MIEKWLHISDLHAFKNTPENRSMRKKFIKFVNENYNDTLDYLIISGDLSDKDTGYSKSIELIEHIKPSLKDSSKKNIIICPGNHDVNLIASRADLINTYYKTNNMETYKNFFDKNGALKNNIVKELLSDLGYGTEDEQNSYASVFNLLYDDKFCQKYIHNAFSFEEINFISINTAIFFTKDTQKHNLIIDKAGIYNILENNVNRHKFNVVVGHHPLEWLTDKDKDFILDQFKENRIDLYLSGHEHKGKFKEGVRTHFGINASLDNGQDSECGFSLYSYNTITRTVNVTFYKYSYEKYWFFVDHEAIESAENISKTFTINFDEGRGIINNEITQIVQKLFDCYSEDKYSDLYTKNVKTIYTFYCECISSEEDSLIKAGKDCADFFKLFLLLSFNEFQSTYKFGEIFFIFKLFYFRHYLNTKSRSSIFNDKVQSFTRKMREYFSIDTLMILNKLKEYMSLDSKALLEQYYNNGRSSIKIEETIVVRNNMACVLLCCLLHELVRLSNILIKDINDLYTYENETLLINIDCDGPDKSNNEFILVEAMTVLEKIFNISLCRSRSMKWNFDQIILNVTFNGEHKNIKVATNLHTRYLYLLDIIQDCEKESIIYTALERAFSND